jgi:hypothetical protein
MSFVYGDNISLNCENQDISKLTPFQTFYRRATVLAIKITFIPRTSIDISEKIYTIFEKCTSNNSFLFYKVKENCGISPPPPPRGSTILEGPWPPHI